MSSNHSNGRLVLASDLVSLFDLMLLAGLFNMFLWLLGSPHREVETCIAFVATIRIAVGVVCRIKDS